MKLDFEQRQRAEALIEWAYIETEQATAKIIWQEDRIRELEALVESSYREGFLDGYDDDARPQDADAGWEHSDVRKRLEQPR